MTRRSYARDQRGYFAIGIEHGKTVQNLGTLWRSADLFGAAFVFTVGRRYEKDSSDTMKTWRGIPLWHFASMSDLVEHLPFNCPLIGVELDPRATPLGSFHHLQRACYLLGSEDQGLTKEALSKCSTLVQLPGRASMNVAVAGSIVLYDRHQKETSS